VNILEGNFVRSTVALYTKACFSGGAGLFAQELAQGIADAGGTVLFIAPPAHDKRFELPRPRLERFRSREEITIGPRWKRVASSAARILTGTAGCLRARFRTRVLIVTIPDPLIFVLPLLALLRITGGRIIYVVHDPLPHAWKLPTQLRWLENITFEMAYRLSSGLVTLSSSGRTTLANAYKLDERTIEVIEHGVFMLGAPSPAPGNGLLLMFGTIRRNKGIQEAIEGVLQARERGANVRLQIAGAPDAADPDCWASCEAIARAHPEAINLEIGYIADERLNELVALCDGFLMPYRDFHSQSGVAMVAASNSRSVIASRAGGLGDLIADGLAGVPIEAPADAEAVAEAIVTFTKTPISEWNNRATAYRSKTIKSRAWPVIGAQYLKFVRRIDVL
jgi:glycogen(starch) synthase